MDRARLHPWVVRAAWAVLPFAAGPAFADALDARSVPVRTVASVGLWLVWGVALCGSLVLHPIALTLLRVVAPAAVASAGWAAAQRDVGASGAFAVAITLVALSLVFLPETGVAFVNGPAYPNERRFPLRVPGPLLFGPLVVAWVLTAGIPIAALLLLSARQWIAGGIAGTVGAAAVFFLGRALHGLSRRWVVFVPAGLVLHDPMTLVDPVLFPKLKIAGVEIAAAGTDALDLTQRSPGIALELALREEATLVLTKPGERIGPTVAVDRLLFTPTRPGRVLGELRVRMGAPPSDG
ncbi:MAG TPA: hypothetical protein VM143_05705 [Acidimicrobiales bacterium]|nr:hypothetical protein [Acidimicrobiales bacterium]